jgi:hypothetical protein
MGFAAFAALLLTIPPGQGQSVDPVGVLTLLTMYLLGGWFLGSATIWLRDHISRWFSD